MGAFHAECWLRMQEEVELVAIVDVNTEKASQYAKRSRARLYTDGREMLEQEELDIVDIYVPTFLHAEYLMDTEPDEVCANVVKDKNGIIQHIYSTYRFKDALLVAEGSWDYPVNMPFCDSFRLRLENAAIILNDSGVLTVYPENGEKFVPDLPPEVMADMGINVTYLTTYLNELGSFVENIKGENMKKINYTMYAGFSGMILTDGIEKTCEEALRLGFSSVESFASTMSGVQNSIPDQTTARRVKEVLCQAKLPVACHSVLVDIWKNVNAEKELMKELEIAYELGAPFFHHTMLTEKRTLPDAPEYQEAVSLAVNVASRIADYAKTLGITCIYENQGRYVNGVKGFGGFYHEMKKRCDNVGVCADLGNILFVNEKPESFLQEYIQDICHVHVKDYLWKQVKESPGRYWLQAEGDNWLRETMVGSGVVDFAVCMKMLRENNYQGAVALELWHKEPFEAGVWQAMEYIDRFLVWER